MKHLTKEQIEQIKELRKEIGALNNRQSMIENKIGKLLPNLIDNISEITKADNQKPIDKMLTLKIFESHPLTLIPFPNESTIETLSKTE